MCQVFPLDESTKESTSEGHSFPSRRPDLGFLSEKICGCLVKKFPESTLALKNAGLSAGAEATESNTAPFE